MPAQIRSAVTMVALVGVLLIGVAWAWSAVTEPFPEREEATTCRSTTVEAGEKVFPDQVTVSVLNASSREGLANRTMTDLVGAGLSEGNTDNAPTDTKLRGVEIWTDDPANPAVRLVKSFLPQRAKVVEREPPLDGVVVVVGERFKGLADKGRESVTAEDTTTICSPTQDDDL